MPRRFAFESLHSLAENRLEAATRRLAQLQQQLKAEEDKLAQLKGFEEEYRRRMAQVMAEGMDVVRMRDYHAFLSRIETAIRHQRAEVERRRMEWEQGRQAWLEERRRLKTYEVLKTRHARAEQVREKRLAQREQDEHVRRQLGSAAPTPDRRR